MEFATNQDGAHRAVFLDRDGVINLDTGYPWRISDIIFKDGIFDFCRAAIAQGFRLIVVTNQAGIGRGFYTESDFRRLTRWMSARFEQEAAPLTAVYYCPYHPCGALDRYRRESYDRKPNPGMLLKAARAHAIALGQSMIVGDRESDMEAGYRAGLPRRYLLNEAPSNNANTFATRTVGSLGELTRLLESDAPE